MKCQTINNKIKNAQHRNQIQQRNKEENKKMKNAKPERRDGREEEAKRR